MSADKPKPYGQLTSAEKDQRWKDAHQAQIRERKEILVKDGMRPDDAERKAARDQERITNQARGEYRRADGRE